MTIIKAPKRNMFQELIQDKLKEKLCQLGKQLDLLQINKESVCVAGSFVLTLNNIRKNRDLDLIILPKFKKRITKKKKAFNITEKIEVSSDKSENKSEDEGLKETSSFENESSKTQNLEDKSEK